MSRFNDLYRGPAEDAADALEAAPVATRADDLDEMRLALINALRRLALLERKLALLDRDDDIPLDPYGRPVVADAVPTPDADV